MARQEDSQKEEEVKQGFDQEQLAALETISNERPENVVEAAERIGVLREGIKQRIDDEFKGHVLQFRNTLSKEQGGVGPSKEAFIRAFRTVYGKFVLEETSPEMGKPEGAFMKTMKRVLTPKAFAKMGESPAAKAAAARLSALSSDEARQDAEKRKTEKETEKAEIEAKITEIDSNSAFTADTLKLLNDDVDLTATLKPIVSRLKTSQNVGADFDEMKLHLTAAEAQISSGLVDPNVEALYPGTKQLCADMSSSINEFNAKQSQDIFNDEAEKIVNELAEYVSQFKKIVQNRKPTLEGQVQRLDSEIAGLDSFGGTGVEKGIQADLDKKTKREATLQKKADTEKRSKEYEAKRDGALVPASILNDKINSLEDEKDALNAKISFLANIEVSIQQLASEYQVGLKDKIDHAYPGDLPQLLLMLEDLKRLMPRLTSSEHLPAELKTLCTDYIKAYEGFKAHIAAPKTPLNVDAVKDFFDDNVNVFFKEFARISGDIDHDILTEIDNADKRIAEIDAEIPDLIAKADALQPDIDKYSGKHVAEKQDLKGVNAEIEAMGEEPKDYSPIPHERVLEKAFPAVDPVELFEASEAETHAEDNVKELRETGKFFNKAGNRQKVLKAHAYFDQHIGDHGDESLAVEIKRLKGELQDLKLTAPKNGNVPPQLLTSMKDNRDKTSQLETLLSASKKLHEAMTNFAKHIKRMVEAGIIDSPAGSDVKDILSELESADPAELDSFKADDLKDLYAKLKKFYDPLQINDGDFHDFRREFALAIPKLEKLAKEAKTKHKELKDSDKSQNLSEAQASKQVVATILREQYPDMSDEEIAHMATLILTDDVQTIQTLDSYEKLAAKGNAQLYESVQQAGFEDLLIGMELKEAGGDKIDRPFKGFKPEDLTNIDRLEELITNRKMNLRSGFIALAAYESLHEGTTNLQAVRLTKALKAQLAKELKASDHMTNPEVSAEVDNAFEEMKIDGKGVYDAYSKHHSENKEKWESSRVSQLEEEFKHLVERSKRGNVSTERFAQEKAALLQKAREGGVADKVSFAMDSAMTDFYQGKHAEWIRDLPHKMGEYSKTKGIASVKGLGGLAARFAGGTLGVGFRAGKYLLDKPFRYGLKYPFMLGTKAALFLPRTVFNFFSPKKWNAPFQGMKARWDTDRQAATGYRKEILTGMAGRTGNAIKSAASGVSAAKPTYKPFTERSDFDLEASKERSKELEEAAKRTPADMPASTGVDLSEYKTKIAELIKSEKGSGKETASA